MDSGNDLFVYKAPEVPTSKIYAIRPYLPSDEDAIYAVCNRITGVTGTSAVADRYIFYNDFNLLSVNVVSFTCVYTHV